MAPQLVLLGHKQREEVGRRFLSKSKRANVRRSPRLCSVGLFRLWHGFLKSFFFSTGYFLTMPEATADGMVEKSREDHISEWVRRLADNTARCYEGVLGRRT